jgi:hypothetical protein
MLIVVTVIKITNEYKQEHKSIKKEGAIIRKNENEWYLLIVQSLATKLVRV